MSSEDPREREDLCGQELIPWITSREDDLANLYDEDTWFEDERDRHYCCRQAWEEVDTGRCFWHAEVKNKPSKTLVDKRKSEPQRLDRAFLHGIEPGILLSFDRCRFNEADFTNARLSRSSFEGANFISANLSNAFFGSANLTDVDLEAANLTGGYFVEANFRRAHLPNVDLSDANIAKADFGEAYLGGADFTDTHAWNANFENADLSQSHLENTNFEQSCVKNANLKQANFIWSNLFDANLTKSSLYGSTFIGVKLNEDTIFKNHYSDNTDRHDPDKAAWTLRQLEQLFRENALPAKARVAYLDRKDRRRQQYWDKTIAALRADEPIIDRLGSAAGWARQWSRTALYGATMRYGESPRRVVTLSVLTILAFGVVYPFFGGMDASDEATRNYGFEPLIAGVDGLPMPVVDVLANLYFSAVTFTTLGYGDIRPATPVVELLATVESFVGALLMALLVYVLGRRATW